MNHNPDPSLLLSQTPIKQVQPNQILAPLQPVALPTITTLPEKDEPEPEQQEPEPEKQSEFLPNVVPCELYHADGTPNYGKFAIYIRSLLL